MEQVLKSYLRRLNNLTGNNRSLLLLKLLRAQLIDLHDFNYEGELPSFQIIHKLLAKNEEIFLCEEAESRRKTANELSKNLKKMLRMDKFLFEERGARDLYVGWPFVKGKFADDTLVRAPLMFIPVALTQNQNKWFLQRRKDVNITLNKTFLLAYAHYNGVPPDEELMETVIDDYDTDSLVFRTQLYKLFSKSGTELNFNQENFIDQLQAFQPKTKSQLESEEKTGQLKLYPEAVMGIFPQAGSHLMPDYVQLIESHQFEDLEDFFGSKTAQETQNQLALFDRVNEENTFTPFPLDAYQEHALKEIKKGHSLVVQGPPGTGKSQLISNLICDFAARGKNVLVVCQKRAALDVVYARLKEKEMHDFVALVHDFKNDRKPIFEQINRQINAIEVYEKKNNNLDTLQLERGFLQASRRIDQILEEMDEFKEALFDDGECGKSVKELYLSSSPDQPSFAMNQEYRAFHFDTLHDTQRKFRQYLQYYERFEKKTHFWAQGPSFSGYQSQDLVEILNILREVIKLNDSLSEDTAPFTSLQVDFETAYYLSGKLSELKSLTQQLKEGVAFKVFQQLHKSPPTQDLNWLTQMERVLIACFRGAGVEQSLASTQLGKVQEAMRAASRARKNPISWLRWQLFASEKPFLTKVLRANELRGNKRGLDHLAERIDNRLNFEHSISIINENSWLHNLPKSFRKIDFQDWFYWQKRGLNAYSMAQTIRLLNDTLPVQTTTHSEYMQNLKGLLGIIEEVPRKITQWSPHINIHQIRSLLLGREDPSVVQKLIKKDFDALCEFHKLKDTLKPQETKVLEEMTQQSETVEEAMMLFHNSVSLAWIDHIESKYPNLRDVSSGKLDALAEELREQIEAKRLASKEILLLKSREKTYEDVQYNRLKNRVTYRDLQHQVTKKRRIWPIRKVIHEFGEEIFTLLPCWMCSPESASAIFPMRQQFDLIIFDEASQCFAERGIPAMYRARQLVVAGDSMQLPPSDLYRIRWDAVEEDTPELTIDSLLDLAKRYLPEVTLSGHYRSKSLELIDFSNQHFYGGKLRLLPDYGYVNKPIPAIDFVQTEGILEDGVNKVEAATVVKQVLDILKEQPEKGIGIVTFNYRQQAYILDLLESEAARLHLSVPETLFVKNIENVQGDERDIIIFSITYAADKRGKVKLQFGSLNVDGGEKRLNVAITRSKERVIVVSSLLPQSLKTQDTKNEGPKLLKKYLEYAWAVHHQKWSPYLRPYEGQAVDWFLRHKLAALSFEEKDEFKVSKDLPFADLSVKIKDTYAGLVLTDDERYFQALSPKQIYGFQHFHLSMKSWPHVRFHSREYWLDQAEAQEKLRRFIVSNQRRLEAAE